MTLSANIVNLFQGRDDTIAVQNGEGFRPHKLDGPIKPSWIAKEHLSGKRCLGFYLMTAASQVLCTAVDFDNKPDSPDPEWLSKAESVYYELTGLGLSPLVEISQSGHAAHVWLFFDEPVDAWLVRQFWKAIEESSDVPFVEVYPRQDELSGKGLGNLIRYPFWNKSKIVDAENEWSELDAEESLSSVKKTDTVTLKMLHFQLTGSTPQKKETGQVKSGLSARVDRLVSRQTTLLGRRWQGDMEGLNDRSRSSLCQSIACELVRLYIPTTEIEQAINLWCIQNDYDKGDREDWVSTTVTKAYDFIGGRKTEKHSTSSTMKDAVSDYLSLLEQGTPPCYESGIDELDESIDGVAPGEVCVIAARPSHGKTAFAMQWIDFLSGSGIPCLMISEEMSKRELGKRALLSITHLSEEVWASNLPELKGVRDQHYGDRAPIHVVESCQSIDEVERQIDEHCELYETKLVAVDYLQLLGSDHSGRYDSVTEISRRLKQAATRNQVAMLVLCQLNRQIESREKHEPQLSDLRESGQIEQDADLVLMLQWPVKYDKTVDEKTYKIFCAKRRNGPIRTRCVFSEFDANHQRFGLPKCSEWEPSEGEYERNFG